MAYNHFRIFRPSNVLKEKDAVHIERPLAAVAEVRQALKECCSVDTFAGRKTQELFLKEETE
jgi:hypothetical protein